MIAQHTVTIWWMLPVLVLSWVVQIALVVVAVRLVARGVRYLRGR